MDRKQKLTKRVVDALDYEAELDKARRRHKAEGREWEPATNERVIVWDTEDKKLGVRVYPSGEKSFVMRYTVAGRRRLMVLGPYGELAVQQAREVELPRKLKEVYAGKDPVEEKRRVKVETVGSAWEHFEATALKAVAKSTAGNYRGTYRKHLAKLARRRLDAITTHEVEKLYAGLAEQSIYAANDAIRLLRRLYRVARVPDPTLDAALGGRRPGTLAKEKKRTRYLNADELKALAGALDAEEDQDVADYVRLLLVTGARPFEWRLAEWAWLDLKKGVMRIPREVSKIRPEEEAETRELPPAALEILERVKARQKPRTAYVFPRGDGKAPHFRTWMDKPWKRLVKAAKLKGATLYTLRHTFGSWSVEGGLSLPATAALMGHRDTTTTLRYAHAVRDARKAAAECVSGTLTAMMAGKEGEVVEHPSAAKGGAS